MKKLFVLLVLSVFAICANAQTFHYTIEEPYDYGNSDIPVDSAYLIKDGEQILNTNDSTFKVVMYVYKSRESYLNGYSFIDYFVIVRKDTPMSLVTASNLSSFLRTKSGQKYNISSTKIVPYVE